MTAVARTAGVSRPTVYRRYPDAETLAMAVLHADLQQVWDDVREEYGHFELPPLEFLLSVAGAFYRYYGMNSGLSRSMLQISLFSTGPWTVRFQKQSLSFLMWLAEGLAACQARGELSPQFDVHVASQTYFGCYLTVAIAGSTGAIPTVEAQLAMLEAPLRQHLSGHL